MAVGLYDVKEGKLERRKSVELDVSGARTVIDALAGEAVADLLLINDHYLTYGKIRFDETSIATLKNHLGDISDSLTRALCWSAAWDMHRDGELSATGYTEIVLNALGKENEASVIGATISPARYFSSPLFFARKTRSPSHNSFCRSLQVSNRGKARQ
jgi:aminopeptidase N